MFVGALSGNDVYRTLDFDQNCSITVSELFEQHLSLLKETHDSYFYVTPQKPILQGMKCLKNGNFYSAFKFHNCLT